jgi:hypothetical protein
MNRKPNSIGGRKNNLINQPEALLFVDNSGTYYAGELLTNPQVEQLRRTHKISEIIWESGKTVCTKVTNYSAK